MSLDPSAPHARSSCSWPAAAQPRPASPPAPPLVRLSAWRAGPPATSISARSHSRPMRPWLGWTQCRRPRSREQHLLEVIHTGLLELVFPWPSQRVRNPPALLVELVVPGAVIFTLFLRIEGKPADGIADTPGRQEEKESAKHSKAGSCHRIISPMSHSYTPGVSALSPLVAFRQSTLNRFPVSSDG